MMIIENRFNLGESVYLKTDKEQLERLVTGIQVSPCGITYRIALGERETWHFDMELSLEKNILATVTN